MQISGLTESYHLDIHVAYYTVNYNNQQHTVSEISLKTKLKTAENHCHKR